MVSTRSLLNSLLAAALLAAPAAAAPGKVGDAAPAFSLTRLDGKHVTLRSLKGKVVVIDFWATWCAPCLATMPDAARLQHDYGGKGLVVLGVSLDDDDAKLKAFMARRPPGITVVKPDAAFNHAYGTFLGLKGDALVTPDKLIQANLPTWILIDRKGRVAAIHKSSTEEKQLLAEAGALAGRS